MRPGGTLAPMPTISCWNAAASCVLLSFLSSEPPVVISEGNHPTIIRHQTDPTLLGLEIEGIPALTRSDTVDADVDVFVTEIEGHLPGHMHSSSFAYLVLVSFVDSVV